MDAQTLESRAIEVTDNSVGDAPMLLELMAQIPAAEPVASVSADGAYDTRACHEAIAQRGAAAVIPPCKNAQLWRSQSAGGKGAQRSDAGLQAPGASDLEDVEWLSSAQPGGDQDALLQTTG